jgi:hypothetical protein
VRSDRLPAAAHRQLTRNNANIALLKKHQADNLAATKRAIDVEVMGVRIGDFVLVTFPGELTVPIGLGIKERSPHKPTLTSRISSAAAFLKKCPSGEN